MITEIHTGDPVKFVRCTIEEFENIVDKDPSTIYFCTACSDTSGCDNSVKDDNQGD